MPANRHQRLVGDYATLDKAKINLMCTFHPSQTTPDRFFPKLDALLDAGFQIGMVNYVMDADNFSNYLHYKELLWKKGIPLHPNPLWDGKGNYSKEQVELLRSELPEADFLYRSGTASPYLQKCLFPALAYELNYKGEIHVGCHSPAHGSFFDETLPDLFAGPVPCPYRSCVCLDKYSFLETVNRNSDLNPLRIYGKDLRARNCVAASRTQPHKLEGARSQDFPPPIREVGNQC